MKKKLYLLLLAIAMPFLHLAKAEDNKNKVNVAVHEPIELLITIYHLSPPAKRFIKSTKRQRDWVDVLIQPLTAPFQDHKDHEAVQSAIRLYEKYKVWLPTLVNIGIQNRQLPLDPNLFESKENLDFQKDVRDFIRLANQFYTETQFKKIFEQNRQVYQAIEEEVRNNMPDPNFYQTMEDFYQKSFHSYNLYPSPLLPAGNGMGFGPRLKTEDGYMIFNVFSGVEQPQIDPKKIVKPNGFYGYPKWWVRNISTHEFGHSFVNAPLFVYHKELKQHKQLLKPIAKKMRKQAYRDWGTVLAEHLVRMGEVRIADLLGLEGDSKEKLRYNYLDRHFIYLPHFLKVIEKYEGDSKYKTFQDFIPVIVDSLSDIDVKQTKKKWKKVNREWKKQKRNMK